MTDADILTTRQKRAITALLTLPSIAEAARSTGICERTLLRWKKLPAFQTELTSAEDEALATATRQLVTLANDAIDTIRKILTDVQITPGVRLRAAEAVLANLLRLRELVDLENRIAKLEAAQTKKDKSK